MQLTLAEKNEFFDRFKNRTDSELKELKARLEAKNELEKAGLIQLVLNIRSQDFRGLRRLIRMFEGQDRWKEYDFATDVMNQNFARTIVKRRPPAQTIVKRRPPAQKKAVTRVVRPRTVRVSENETLVTLVCVAMEDPAVRHDLALIASLDSFSRKSVLSEYDHKLQLMNAPLEFRKAIALLADDEVAARVLQMVGGSSGR